MTPSNKCIILIKKCESFSSIPYLCPAKKPTIGYGTTIYPSEKKISMGDNPITEEQAMYFLENYLEHISKNVFKYIKQKITQSQFDAICCFIYNIGFTDFINSTLLKKININPNDITIKDEFKRWIYATVDGEKVKLKGLIIRRNLESELYFS